LIIMRKVFLRKTLAYAAVALLALQSCKDDSNLITSLPVPDQSLVEEFDTLASAKGRGWVIRNRSEPIGPAVWQQGLSANAAITYAAYSSKSTANGFISTDYSSAFSPNPGESTISNWIISPKVILQNGDKIIFYSRIDDTLSTYGDRMQVLINKNNDGIECGRGATWGDFDTKLLDINPLNASGNPVNPFPAGSGYPANIYFFDPVMAYPAYWTRFEAVVKGLDAPTNGRFAIRYFVPLGGTDGRGGSCISVDSVAYISASRR
jgi:hypothetical protein